MKRTDEDLLRDMLDSIAAIRRHPPASREVLNTDEVLSRFIQKELEIIGEAASKLTPVTRAKAPGFAWGKIVGMRNRLVHDYARVDLDVVWATVANDLEPLRAQVERIVAELEQPGAKGSGETTHG